MRLGGLLSFKGWELPYKLVFEEGEQAYSRESHVVSIHFEEMLLCT